MVGLLSSDYGNLAMAEQAGLLAPAPASIPQVSPRPVEDNSALIAATQIGKDKEVPAAYIIEMIKKIAWHESRDNPLRRQDVEIDGEVKPVGVGRGALQFEGYYEQLDDDGKEMSFKDAVDRARNYYTDELKKPVPQWLKDIKKGDDARSLSKNKQYALAIYDFRMKKGADISKVYKGEQTLLNFWENSHWAGPGRSGNPNSTQKQRDVAEERGESFANSMDLYKTDLNATWN